jgi:two-component system, cell cycle response regulator
VSDRDPKYRHQGTVLLIEPEVELGHLLEVLLGLVFERVERTRSATEAESVLLDLTPEMVVIDLLLPDVDGREFLRRVRAGNTGVPILAIDSSPGEQLRAPALLAGADQVITTPPDLELVLATVQGLMRRARSEERTARTDALTGFLNRSGLETEWVEARAIEGAPPAIAVLEIDGFDAVRLDLGLASSERALVSAAYALAAELEPSGTLARWGGETFGVLLPGVDAPAAGALVEAALRGFRDTPITRPDGESFRLTFSAGVVLPGPDGDFDAAITAAARLLDQARRTGGNRVVGESPRHLEQREKVILLAEDDPLTAELLRHRLEREGYRLLHAKDGVTAYEEALKSPVALAILDVKMPGMDGFELLERLRRIPAWTGVPVIMLTGMGRESDVVRGFRLGADDYVVKPFSPQEFLARIRRFLP